MAVQKLSLESIPELDPGIVLAFNNHLKRAAQDCEDRPADRKPRKVTLEVMISPVMDLNTRECASTEIDLQTTSTIPAYRTRTYSVGMRKNGILAFNPDSPDNCDQGTFDMGDDD
jgi:hypothetical protein